MQKQNVHFTKEKPSLTSLSDIFLMPLIQEGKRESVFNPISYGVWNISGLKAYGKKQVNKRTFGLLLSSVTLFQSELVFKHKVKEEDVYVMTELDRFPLQKMLEYDISLRLNIKGKASSDRPSLRSVSMPYFDYSSTCDVEIQLQECSGLGNYLYRYWLAHGEEGKRYSTPFLQEALSISPVRMDYYRRFFSESISVKSFDSRYKETGDSSILSFSKKAHIGCEYLLQSDKSVSTWFNRQFQADFFYSLVYALIVPDESYTFLMLDRNTGHEEDAREILIRTSPLKELSAYYFMRDAYGVLWKKDEDILKVVEEEVTMTFAEAEKMRRRTALWG